MDLIFTHDGVLTRDELAEKIVRCDDDVHVGWLLFVQGGKDGDDDDDDDDDDDVYSEMWELAEEK